MGGKDRGDAPEKSGRNARPAARWCFTAIWCGPTSMSAPNCGHHMRIGPAETLCLQPSTPAASPNWWPGPTVPADPLRFRGEKKYADEIKGSAAPRPGGPKKPSPPRAAPFDGLPVMIGVQPFDFLGGSLGMGVGEALVESLQAAAKEKRPYILFVASGGARMQEGILSLMQMPRATICAWTCCAKRGCRMSWC